MSKMTPTQEANYALDWNVARSGLTPAAQAEYDRILAEQQASGRYEEPPSTVELEAEGRRVIEDARQAIKDGRKVFLCRIPMMYDRKIALGTSGLSTPSSLVESIEDLGWRLDQMSWVPRPASAFRAEGIFLFRRDPQALRPSSVESLA